MFIYQDEKIPINKWINAKVGNVTPDGKHVKSNSKLYALRPGWHSCNVPLADHIGTKQKDGTLAQSKDTVWCEIEISDNIPMRKSQTKRPTKKLTKKVKRRSSVNRRYIKTDNLIAPPENKDEEDDKSNYDPDLKILNKFLKEQNKEKENFIAGKIKLPEEKNN